MMLQVQPILSILGIMTEMKIWNRSYCYWLLSRKKLRVSAIDMQYEITLCYKISEP